MDIYTLLKFAHIMGFTLLGGGLLAVWVSEFRAYRTEDIKEFAEASRYTAIFYDGLVIPGALTLGLSGYFLMQELGLGFFDQPWLVAMWGLFLFEFIEGNTITRVQFRKTLRSSQSAFEAGKVLTEEVREEFASGLHRLPQSFEHCDSVPVDLSGHGPHGIKTQAPTSSMEYCF